MTRDARDTIQLPLASFISKITNRASHLLLILINHTMMSVIEFVSSYRITRTCSHASLKIFFDGDDGKKIFFLNKYQLAFSRDENDDVHTTKCKGKIDLIFNFPHRSSCDDLLSSFKLKSFRLFISIIVSN